jgi:hypothetical protein
LPVSKDSIDPAKLPGTVVDESQAALVGSWSSSAAAKAWIGAQYRHDEKAGDGRSSARFEARLPAAGRYEVRFAYPPNNNRASNVPVEIHSAEGVKTVTLNERETPPIDGLFVSLGTFEFTSDKPAAVIVTNKDTDGYVVVDAVQWLPVK